MNRRFEGQTRRRFLATATAGGMAVTAGCLDRLVGGSSNGATQLSLTVKSVPSDEDPQAAEIARRFTEVLSEIGIDVSFVPRAAPQFSRDVFYGDEFDVFVERSPIIDDPSVLTALLHSSFAEVDGIWLNPFGFEHDEVDSLIDTAVRESAETKQQTLDTLQKFIAGDLVPFSVVGLPDELTAVGTALPPSRQPEGLSTATDLLHLGESGESPPMESFDIGVMNGQLIADLNPIRWHHPLQSTIVDLIYDPLIRMDTDAEQGWISNGIVWQEEDDATQAEVFIREGLTWQDGSSLDAADVAFTYSFLRDLTGGDYATRIPAGQYAGKIAHVKSVEFIEDHRVRFTFEDVLRSNARRALTVPIFPEHIWSERIGVDESGISLAASQTIPAPVGSGPFAVADIEPAQQLRLDRYQEHVAFSEMNGLPAPPFETIRFTVPTRPPNVGTAVNMIANGELDLLANVPADATRPVVLNAQVDLEARAGRQYYLLGFNTRKEPFDDPALRRAFGRLLDRTFLTATAFGGFGTPAESPLAGSEWATDELTWSGESVLGRFPGSGGHVRADEARDFFTDLGFAFDPDLRAIVFDD